jgi:chaperone required for assembly of F1-ATPase
MTAAEDAAGSSAPSKVPSQAARPLSRRAYKAVTLAHSTPARGALRILLDGNALRTPAKAVLSLPTRALAEAVAAEWVAQGEHIDPGTMPLTRLVNSAIDGVGGREAEVAGEIANYGASDLLCYRATGPAPLVRRQAQLWDPVLAWGRDVLGIPLLIAAGIMPLTQPEAARSALARALADHDQFALAALHVMTTVMGSALLALAHARGRLRLEEAWAAAHVDEDWQISQWGKDPEAAARRQRQWDEVAAASRLLNLLLPAAG